jgi:hypothetical protein
MTALNRPEALLVAGRFPSTSLPGLYFEAQAIPRRCFADTENSVQGGLF